MKPTYEKPRVTYESWVALDVEMLLDDKERKRMSMAWRLWELALAKMNNHGHAAFRRNELVIMACGKVSRSDTQAVYRGLKALAEMGRIAPVGPGGSTLYCIRVNTDIAQRAAGKGNYKFLCSEPSHMEIRQEPFTVETPDNDDQWGDPEAYGTIDHWLTKDVTAHNEDASVHTEDDPWQIPADA